LLTSFALICGSAAAQDDLFSDAPGLFGAEPAAAQPPADEATEIDDALIRQMLEYANRGELQLAESIASLVRLQRWQEVDRLLARTAGMNISDERLAEMFGRLGPAVYLRVKQRSDLSGSAQAGMDKIRDAAAKIYQSEDRLEAAIAQLGSSSIDQQLEATRTLLSGGDAAIALLIDAAVIEQPAEKRDRILRTLVALGGGGVDGLQQLALYGAADTRTQALASLARISPQAYLVDLVSASHAADATEAERQTAASWLERLGGLPTREAATEALALDLRRKHDIAKRIDNDGQTTNLWSVNEQRTGVTHKPVLLIHAAYRDLYDAAARLRRLGNLSPELDTATLAITMGYNLMLDPDWGDPDQIQPIRESYGPLLTGSSLSDVLQYALDSDDHAAAIGLIRLIDPEAISDQQRHELLDGTAGVPSPLIQAVRSPEPRVRYEAALKAARLAESLHAETPHAEPAKIGTPHVGTLHYAGSSQVMRTLSEMAALGDKPKVILVETRPQEVLAIETLLSDLGLQVEVVSSMKQLQRSVARGGDLRLVIAKNDYADLPAVEMIDLVRRIDRGRRLPIAVYGGEAPFLGGERWDAPTTWIEDDVTLSSLDDLLDLVRRSRRMPPLTILDRQDYREQAASILERTPTIIGQVRPIYDN
jgi:hypothetical protein